MGENEVNYSGGESSQQHPSSSDQNGSRLEQEMKKGPQVREITEKTMSKELASLPNERTQPSKNNDTAVERTLAAERMQMIKEQQLKWTQLGKSPNKEKTAQSSKDTAKIKQRMEMIKQQQERFNNLGKTQMDSKPEPISRNLASEKITMIKQQQEKFNNLGKKSAVLEDDKKVETSNKATSNSSDETAKPKSAVQKRKEALENAQKEAAKRNNPKAHMKVLWKQKGVNRFQKVTEDERGVAPKKSLDELP